MMASLISEFMVEQFLTKIDLKKRDDLIPFTKESHQFFSQKNLSVRSYLDSQTRTRVTNFIINYWDRFFKYGARRPILVHEFSIDTRTAKPVCCHKPQYKPYELKIVMSQIEALLQNKCIEECGGPWGSSIILAAKPRQEHVYQYLQFLWRICIS